MNPLVLIIPVEPLFGLLGFLAVFVPLWAAKKARDKVVPLATITTRDGTRRKIRG